MGEGIRGSGLGRAEVFIETKVWISDYGYDAALHAFDIPIPGTTRLHRLEENAGAADVVLAADDLREIEDAAARITVHGDRYPAHLQARVGR